MRLVLQFVSISCALALHSTVALAVTFTLNGGGQSYVETIAVPWNGPGVIDRFDLGSLPASGSLEALAPCWPACSGDASSTATYALSSEGFQITFDDFRTNQTSLNDTRSRIYLSPDVDVDFAASGSCTVVGTTQNRLTIQANLYDLTTGTFVFEVFKSTSSSFTPTTLAFDPPSTGSLTGTLLAGHQYALYLSAHGEIPLGACCPSGVTGTGTGRFDIAFESDPACNDALDNDGDGFFDSLDPGCADADDDSERDASLPCNDGIDNDADGLADFTVDPGCKGPTSFREDPRCNDGNDNDGDGMTDWDGGPLAQTADPQCAEKPWRDSEASSACGVGAELVLVVGALSLWRKRARRPR